MSIPASQFTFTDQTVQGGKEYNYYVTAMNERGGESAPSQSFKVVPITVPSGMTAPTEVTHDLTSITVEWQPPTNDGDSDITKYILYSKAEYQTSYVQIYSGLSLSYRSMLLQPGFEYRFKVKAINALGPSAMSEASVAITTALVSGPPTGITLVARNSQEITFKWSPPESTGGVKLYGYKVYMAQADSVFTLIPGAPSMLNPTFIQHTQS